MRHIGVILAALALYLVTTVPAGVAQTGWKLAKAIPVGGIGAWDYLTVDPETHRLFIPRSTHTMVLDANTGKTLGDIRGGKRSRMVWRSFRS